MFISGHLCCYLQHNCHVGSFSRSHAVGGPSSKLRGTLFFFPRPCATPTKAGLKRRLAVQDQGLTPILGTYSMLKARLCPTSSLTSLLSALTAVEFANTKRMQHSCRDIQTDPVSLSTTQELMDMDAPIFKSTSQRKFISSSSNTFHLEKHSNSLRPAVGILRSISPNGDGA